MRDSTNYRVTGSGINSYR